MLTQHEEFSNTWPSAILNIKYINKMSLKLHTYKLIVVNITISHLYI